MQSQIMVVDYGMGNLNSVKRKLYRLNVNAIITSSPSDIEMADKIILPGVGHFKKAMENLNKLNLLDVLNETVIVKRKPILGICLGMQLMANRSEEGDADGLGWIDANVVRFSIKDHVNFKIPHMGWNQIIKMRDSLLMNNIPELSEFYFVHSYHLAIFKHSDIINETEYEYRFPSAIEKDNIFGVQYHPEKSHDVGEMLLKNFISL
jgi:imidazole glycerol-phosphate synthase subunit HisH